MTFLEISLCVLCFLLSACLAWALRMLYKTGLIVLTVQDTLEESLDIIDNRVDSIDRILDIPLFSDSPEIKNLRRDMIACREAIMDVAFSLSSSMKPEQDLNNASPAEQQ